MCDCHRISLAERIFAGVMWAFIAVGVFAMFANDARERATAAEHNAPSPGGSKEE